MIVTTLWLASNVGLCRLTAHLKNCYVLWDIRWFMASRAMYSLKKKNNKHLISLVFLQLHADILSNLV